MAAGKTTLKSGQKPSLQQMKSSAKNSFSAIDDADGRDRRYRLIRNVLLYTLLANLAVSLGKGIVGWRGGSIGMIADGFHSLMDGASNVIGLIGIRLAARPRDASHTYGHAKFETFASIGIVVLLLVTAAEIGRSVYERLTAETPQLPEAGLLAFSVMGVTIAVNLFVSFYERNSGKKLNSTFLVADSRHTLSDVYVSISVIASLVAVNIGFPILDALVAGAIALVIAYSALRIMKDASFVLLDRSAVDSEEIKTILTSVEGIRGCHNVRTRGSESGLWIDLHILVDPEMTTKESHAIASLVERRLKDAFGKNTDSVIHIEPYE